LKLQVKTSDSHGGEYEWLAAHCGLVEVIVLISLVEAAKHLRCAGKLLLGYTVQQPERQSYSTFRLYEGGKFLDKVNE
jgi:hypothetical protein